ncbi:MAG: hypothetical protein V4594_17875 [Bacteroidota bacterium]
MKRLFNRILFAIMLNTIAVSGLIAAPSEYTATLAFPAGFQTGDYIEFLRVSPASSGAGGNYEISIAYTRGNIAAAATYIASFAHAGAGLWREAGRINSNGYVIPGSDGHNFTIDVNTEYANPRMRIRAIRTLGVTTEAIGVYIKVRSINENSSWTTLSVTGNDLSVNKFVPMTNDWSLYVGNTVSADGASIAIKALENGNVGIGTATPTEKLSVKGKIRAQEIKVETNGWADFVFAKGYKLPSLQATEQHILAKGHLPGIPSAAEVAKDGIELGEMNKKLLQKIEEMTLYLISQKKEIEALKANAARNDEQNKIFKSELQDLKLKLK